MKIIISSQLMGKVLNREQRHLYIRFTRIYNKIYIYYS